MERLAEVANNLRSKRLVQHIQEKKDAGAEHRVEPRHDSNCRSFVHVLDLPLPQTLAWQPERCQTCRLQRASQGSYAVQDQDIQEAAPAVLRHDPKSKGMREKSIFFTRKWLLHVLQNFSESLSAREVRRSLMHVYSANMLGYQIGNHFLPFFHAIPSSHALRSLLRASLDAFLDKQVAEVQRLVSVYSGQIVRSDGHWTLARRIYNAKAPQGRRRPYTALRLG